MTPIRYLYPGGIEAVTTNGGWRLLHGARDDLVFPSVAEISEALRRRPVVVISRVANHDPISLLIDHSTKGLFDECLSELMNQAREPATLFHVHHIVYTLGATAYHCEQLAECYASISKDFARLPSIPGALNGEPAMFGRQPTPYYEFDACITAARRLFEACRHLMWKTYGRGGPGPDGFWNTLVELRKSPSLADIPYDDIEGTWSQYGRRLSDYRNCIIHHVPVDFGMTAAWMQRDQLGVWVTRIKIPDNPEAQAREAFSFSGNLDALEYCLDLVWAIAKLARTVVDATSGAARDH